MSTRSGWAAFLIGIGIKTHETKHACIVFYINECRSQTFVSSQVVKLIHHEKGFLHGRTLANIVSGKAETHSAQCFLGWSLLSSAEAAWDAIGKWRVSVGHLGASNRCCTPPLLFASAP